jgi:hypothetical protein
VQKQISFEDFILEQVHTSIAELVPELAVVVVESLQILVDISNSSREVQVESLQNPNIPTTHGEE